MNSDWVTDSIRETTDEGRDKSNVKLLKEGTLLFGFKLSIGKMAFAGKDLCTNEAIAGLVPKDDRVLPRYLYYVLREIDFSSYAQPASKGFTLNKIILERIRIPLPSRPKQEEFVEIMDRMEAERKQREAEITKIRGEERAFILPLLAS